MAYLGASPVDKTTGARPRSEYLGDGIQYIYPLDQAVPGGFESNLFVVVDNVVQEPVEAYLISNLEVLYITNISGNILKNQFITQGSVKGIVVQATTTFVRVYRTTNGNSFSNGAVTFSATDGGTTVGSATVSQASIEEGTGLHFTGVPELGQNIYAVHLGGLTYQSVPSAGSVTAESLATNLKAFTVDKFTSTLGQTVFNLSVTPASSQSILVTVNGSVYTDNSDFTLSGTTLTMAVALAAGAKVTVFHLGFGTVSRNAFTDGSVSTRALEDNAVKTAKVQNGAITGPKLSNNAIATSLGYVPVSKNGDTINGNLTVDNLTLAQGALKGRITFPPNPSLTADPYTLDCYAEGEWEPQVKFNGASVGLTYISLGRYTKIGNRVFLTGVFDFTNKGTSTGVATVSGLPFSPSTDFGLFPQTAFITVDNCTSIPGGVFGYLTASSGSIQLFSAGTGTKTALTDANFANNSEIYFQFTYLTND
jgi:hypothetical protein